MQSLTRFSLALIVGFIGGLIFYVIGLPLPFLLGALCATIIASVYGAPIEVSRGIRNYIIVIIGLVLGGTFTPDIIEHVPDWIPTLTASVIYVGVITFVAQIYCRKVAGMDNVTALFAGLPGGLSEMIILGEDAGADVKKLSLTHACRVASVLLVIPFILTYWFDLGEVSTSKAPVLWNIQDLAILVACGVVGMFGGKLLKLPAHRLTGPLILSSILHLNGLIISEPPEWASVIIQLVLGSAIGSRFFGVTMKDIGKLLSVALGMTVCMLTITFIASYIISNLTGVSFFALVLALAPGGFAEMALAALSMGIDPAFVTTHHALRLFVIVFVTPLIIRIVLHKDKKSP